jgi:hypothetical protein
MTLPSGHDGARQFGSAQLIGGRWWREKMVAGKVVAAKQTQTEQAKGHPEGRAEPSAREEGDQ